MTIDEIVLKTGIPKQYLLKEAGLAEDVPARQPPRDWIREYGKTPPDLREAVECYRAEKHWASPPHCFSAWARPLQRLLSG